MEIGDKTVLLLIEKKRYPKYYTTNYHKFGYIYLVFKFENR
jgi:hypothetical protein